LPAAPLTVAEARSIDDVIAQLDAVVDWSVSAGSRTGYFAALYRAVTVQVRDGIRAGRFDNAERMERFDVTFANRYLDALALHLRGETPSRCWAFAFSALDEYWPIVLQHLLLGMNAHINLDLGIAAAQVVRGEDPEVLHADFNRINDILAAMIDRVQRNLAIVWPPLRILNRFLGSVDDQLIRFSMDRARDEAWQLASRFSAMPDSDWPAATGVQDGRMLEIANLVRRPGPRFGIVAKIVRIGEVQGAGDVIGCLSRVD
jgi:Family of unknown function (DUF5995)